ncbi:MAG: tagaturonate epimerase family protein, partial [Eubacteriales bacterium]|nr:tagaturonate epimerase family protein [Eubacteriales bacterium]
EAKNFYYVSGDPSKTEDPSKRADEALIDYLKNDDSRQLLHITYGYVLEDSALKKELYQTLEENEDHFTRRLVSHIGRHLELIKLARKES